MGFTFSIILSDSDPAAAAANRLQNDVVSKTPSTFIITAGNNHADSGSTVI